MTSIAAPEPEGEAEPMMDGTTSLVLELDNHRERVQRGEWWDCSCGEAYLDWACHIAEIMKDTLTRHDDTAELLLNRKRSELHAAQLVVRDLKEGLTDAKERLASSTRLIASQRDSLHELHEGKQRLVDHAMEIKTANERRWGPRRQRIEPDRVIKLLGDPPITMTMEDGDRRVVVPEIAELRGLGGKISTQSIGLKWIATYAPPRRWLRRGGIVTAVSDGSEEQALGLLRIAVAARGLG